MGCMSPPNLSIQLEVSWLDLLSYSDRHLALGRELLYLDLKCGSDFFLNIIASSFLVLDILLILIDKGHFAENRKEGRQRDDEISPELIARVPSGNSFS